jgi:hypothetical protein
MKSAIRGLRRASVVTTFVVAACTGLLVAGPANAAAISAPSAARACSINVDTSEYHCYSSHSAMLGALEAKGPLAVESESATPASALTSYVLAVFYMDASYGGSSLTSYSSYSGLCTSHSYTANSMPSGWNDDISSYLSYGTCKTKVYENINLGGSSHGRVADASNLGAMNDKTSSYSITG